MNFLELVKARHSVRSYVERPIEQSKLDYILECVRLSPSAVNFQPWKFAVVTEKPAGCCEIDLSSRVDQDSTLYHCSVR